MKKSFCTRLGVALACLALCAGSASAETGGRWENEYEAYGRKITVNVEICVPEKEQIPFLAVAPMEELPARETEKYREYFGSMDRSGSESVFSSKRNRIIIDYSDYVHHPDLSNAEKVTTPNRTLTEFDRDTAYTEDNDLTVGEAEQLVNGNIGMVYPSVSFRVLDVVANDRTKYRKTGEKLSDKGYYELDCMQVFDGVPLAGSVHGAYRRRIKHDFIMADYGTAYINATDRNHFGGSYELWDVTGEPGMPDRLLYFDEARPAIEKLILSGNIRRVYHVYLGYAQYDMPEGSPYEYVLAPAWVFRVGWMDDPEEDTATEKSVNGTDLAEGCIYLPVIVNAVSGEVTYPLDEGEGRMLLPASCLMAIPEIAEPET